MILNSPLTRLLCVTVFAYNFGHAKVVELVDTLVSEASARMGLGVQVPLFALLPLQLVLPVVS